MGKPKNTPKESCVMAPETKEMDEIFKLCRMDEWDAIYEHVVANSAVGVELMTMDNHITTTITHQAITSKGDVAKRAKVVERILATTPKAAAIKNGYGSLPLHVICQRNTKMTSRVKERLIYLLIDAHPEALVEEGGTGKRTPLHIIFTDYINPRLVDTMIERGAKACFMRDKKGWLPAHVACSRHCSPDKLRMLLRVNPESLKERTYDGKTLLDLASASATRSHPNFALIDELNRHLKESRTTVVNTQPRFRPPSEMLPKPSPLQYFENCYPPPPTMHHTHTQRQFNYQYAPAHIASFGSGTGSTQVPSFGFPMAPNHFTSSFASPIAPTLVTLEESSSDGASNRSRLGSNDSEQWSTTTERENVSRTDPASFNIVTPRTTASRKRKPSFEGVATAYSLLMLSRENPSNTRARVSIDEENGEEETADSPDESHEPQPPVDDTILDEHGRPVQIVNL